jgi:dipeptidyl aminopeptidase/acylaminoacyl peptidase
MDERKVARRKKAALRFQAECPSASARATTLNHNRIVFASDRDGDFELYSIEMDGTNLRQLTFNDLRDGRPDWSPDGNRIAFVRDDPHKRSDKRIWILNVTTGTECRWPFAGRHRDLDQPVWSPDGKWIAYADGDCDGSSVLATRLDGLITRYISAEADSSLHSEPAWAPTHSVTTWDNFGSVPILRARRAGRVVPDWVRTIVKSTHGLTGLNGPEWDSSGRLVVSLGSDADYDNDLERSESHLAIVSRSAKMRWITEGESTDLGPSLSPSGDLLVFYSDREGTFDLFRKATNGEDLVQLTSGPARDITPDWSS